MNSVTDFTRKVTDSTADFVESVMDLFHDKRHFMQLGKNRGPSRLDIPETYEDPLKDARELRERLDKEALIEREKHLKSRSPETSTVRPLDGRKTEKSRSRGSNTSSRGRSEGGKTAEKSDQSLEADDADPLANFADFEQTTPVYHAPTPLVEVNPFESRGEIDDLVDSLDALQSSDLTDLINKLIARNPSVRATISACTSI